MGCGSCISEHIRNESARAALQERTRLIRQRAATLKPCRLVDQSALDEVLKNIETSLKRQGTQGMPATDPEDIQPQQHPIKSTRECWKSFVFCSDEDLYQQHPLINTTARHRCFDDIEKDVDRTFPDVQEFQEEQKKVDFKETLQKLSLYFPRLGYTQGINFVVGYLLIEGFSREDTFWMIVHLFLKEEFLFLGLFQDGFPLSEIYCRLFRHLFRRHCNPLSEHFDQLGVDDKMWIFKWFLTAYIYSLPLEAIHHVWDYMMVVGGLGLVYFAVSLVKSLESHLKVLREDTEVMRFFTSLREPEVFHSLVNLPCVLLNAYTIRLEDEEIERISKQIREVQGISNFYLDYFSSYTNHGQKRCILSDWHKEKSKERCQFFLEHGKTSKIEWKTEEGGFRVKKQPGEKEVVKLPKMAKDSQSPIPIKLRSGHANLMERVEPTNLCAGSSEEKEIGQYAHKISFKKKNRQNQEMLVDPPRLQKEMSDTVLQKRTPRRTKRRQSGLSPVSKSSKSSNPSERISVMRPDMAVATEHTIEESVEQLWLNDEDGVDTGSAK